MTEQALIAASTPSPMTSLREQPASTLATAIHSPHDAGKALKRVNAVLGLYFDPDFDAETRALVRQEFVVALANYPDWAVQRAFDRWVADMRRRPSPGEIVILVQRELKPIADELARRRKHADEAEEERRRAAAARCSAEAAQEVLERAGFTPKRMAAVAQNPMARTLEEAEARAEVKARHWSETASPDDPRFEQLRKARAAMGMI